MTIDLYLRADTEADLIAALPWARIDDEDTGPRWLDGGDGWALSIVGPVVTAPGAYDEDGAEIEPPTIDGRFHANLRVASAELAESVPAEIIVSPAPATPARVWAQ